MRSREYETVRECMSDAFHIEGRCSAGVDAKEWTLVFGDRFLRHGTPRCWAINIQEWTSVISGPDCNDCSKEIMKPLLRVCNWNAAAGEFGMSTGGRRRTSQSLASSSSVVPTAEIISPEQHSYLSPFTHPTVSKAYQTFNSSDLDLVRPRIQLFRHSFHQVVLRDTEAEVVGHRSYLLVIPKQ